MARRRNKKRTHLGASNGPANTALNNASVSREPKSMVLRIGASEVGPSVSQLVKDVRAMMEPGTASRLKERRSNRLKDYVTMAGPLGVSHLLLFSRSASGNTNLRLALTPRGPTLHFRVERYSLCKDVKKALKHPKGGSSKEYLTAPLLVMNNFTTPAAPSTDATQPAVPKHLESLLTSIFQSLFPPISPQATPLSSIRRVLLLNRELSAHDGAYTLNLRHYAITTRPTGLSRSLRRLNAADKLHTSASNTKRKDPLPSLRHLPDIADFLLAPHPTASGYTSASESELDTDAEVEVLPAAPRRTPLAPTGKPRADAQPQTQKRAIKLVELGPRLKLRLTKVEEGVCAGKVMWHEHIHKSREEEERMEHMWAARRREREERRRVQRENVERKGKGAKGKAGEEDVDMDAEAEWDSEGFEHVDDEDADEAEGVDEARPRVGKVAVG